MDLDNFEKLMAEIRKFKSDVEQQLATTVANLKCKITSVQEKTSNDNLRRMASSSYQFKRKATNTSSNSMPGYRTPAKTELDQVNTTTAQDQITLLGARNQLDEALAARQKFIKIVDQSELGWAMVNTTRGRFNSRFWIPGSEAIDAFTCA